MLLVARRAVAGDAVAADVVEVVGLVAVEALGRGVALRPAVLFAQTRQPHAALAGLAHTVLEPLDHDVVFILVWPLSPLTVALVVGRLGLEVVEHVALPLLLLLVVVADPWIS